MMATRSVDFGEGRFVSDAAVVPESSAFEFGAALKDVGRVECRDYFDGAVVAVDEGFDGAPERCDTDLFVLGDSFQVASFSQESVAGEVAGWDDDVGVGKGGYPGLKMVDPEGSFGDCEGRGFGAVVDGPHIVDEAFSAVEAGLKEPAR